MKRFHNAIQAVFASIYAGPAKTAGLELILSTAEDCDRLMMNLENETSNMSSYLCSASNKLHKDTETLFLDPTFSEMFRNITMNAANFEAKKRELFTLTRSLLSDDSYNLLVAKLKLREEVK